MYGLLLTLLLLGLSAVDPVGIAAMPFLLLHQRPVFRSMLFLSGSFVALLGMGFVFSGGIGAILLNYEKQYSWVFPFIELVAGAVLLFVAGFLIRKGKTANHSADLSGSIQRRLTMSKGKLFAFGAIIVAVQSTVDVVFVIAMIRMQQLHLSALELFAAITTYALGALAIQLAIVVAYCVVPASQRQRLLAKVRHFTTRYSQRSVILISLVFGSILCVNALFALLGYPHF